jgi:hypothetical protein
MKLRVKGNSLRFRLSQSDVFRLAEAGEVAETVYFAAAPEAKLTYALKAVPWTGPLSVAYADQTVTVSIDREAVLRWSRLNTEVGIYGTVETAREPLDLMIEKDFACLDASEKENQDTFPNPTACRPA